MQHNADALIGRVIFALIFRVVIALIGRVVIALMVGPECIASIAPESGEAALHLPLWEWRSTGMEAKLNRHLHHT